MEREIRFYFEGDPGLKPGFHAFFSALRDEASKKQYSLRLIPAGGTPIQDFKDGLDANPHAWNFLLLDSEGPHTATLAGDLCRKYKIAASRKSSVFWMVQMMESWFHADKKALELYFGKGFKVKRLAANRSVEEIPKKDLESGLKAATRNSSKGDYFDDKVRHGRELLTRIAPHIVRAVAPNCDRLFRAVLKRLA